MSAVLEEIDKKLNDVFNIKTFPMTQKNDSMKLELLASLLYIYDTSWVLQCSRGLIGVTKYAENPDMMKSAVQKKIKRYLSTAGLGHLVSDTLLEKTRYPRIVTALIDKLEQVHGLNGIKVRVRTVIQSNNKKPFSRRDQAEDIEYLREPLKDKMISPRIVRESEVKEEEEEEYMIPKGRQLPRTPPKIVETIEKENLGSPPRTPAETSGDDRRISSFYSPNVCKALPTKGAVRRLTVNSPATVGRLKPGRKDNMNSSTAANLSLVSVRSPSSSTAAVSCLSPTACSSAAASNPRVEISPTAEAFLSRKEIPRTPLKQTATSTVEPEKVSGEQGADGDVIDTGLPSEKAEELEKDLKDGRSSLAPYADDRPLTGKTEAISLEDDDEKSNINLIPSGNQLPRTPFTEPSESRVAVMAETQAACSTPPPQPPSAMLAGSDLSNRKELNEVPADFPATPDLPPPPAVDSSRLDMSDLSLPPPPPPSICDILPSCQPVEANADAIMSAPSLASLDEGVRPKEISLSENLPLPPPPSLSDIFPAGQPMKTSAEINNLASHDAPPPPPSLSDISDIFPAGQPVETSNEINNLASRDAPLDEGVQPKADSLSEKLTLPALPSRSDILHFDQTEETNAECNISSLHEASLDEGAQHKEDNQTEYHSPTVEAFTSSSAPTKGMSDIVSENISKSKNNSADQLDDQDAALNNSDNLPDSSCPSSKSNAFPIQADVTENLARNFPVVTSSEDLSESLMLYSNHTISSIVPQSSCLKTAAKNEISNLENLNQSCFQDQGELSSQDYDRTDMKLAKDTYELSEDNASEASKVPTAEANFSVEAPTPLDVLLDRRTRNDSDESYKKNKLPLEKSQATTKISDKITMKKSEEHALPKAIVSLEARNKVEKIGFHADAFSPQTSSPMPTLLKDESHKTPGIETLKERRVIPSGNQIPNTPQLAAAKQTSNQPLGAYNLSSALVSNAIPSIDESARSEKPGNSDNKEAELKMNKPKLTEKSLNKKTVKVESSQSISTKSEKSDTVDKIPKDVKETKKTTKEDDNNKVEPKSNSLAITNGTLTKPRCKIKTNCDTLESERTLAQITTSTKTTDNARNCEEGNIKLIRNKDLDNVKSQATAEDDTPHKKKMLLIEAMRERQKERLEKRKKAIFQTIERVGITLKENEIKKQTKLKKGADSKEVKANVKHKNDSINAEVTDGSTLHTKNTRVRSVSASPKMSSFKRTDEKEDLKSRASQRLKTTVKNVKTKIRELSPMAVDTLRRSFNSNSKYVYKVNEPDELESGHNMEKLLEVNTFPRTKKKSSANDEHFSPKLQRTSRPVLGVSGLKQMSSPSNVLEAGKFIATETSDSEAKMLRLENIDCNVNDQVEIQEVQGGDNDCKSSNPATMKCDLDSNLASSNCQDEDRIKRKDSCQTEPGLEKQITQRKKFTLDRSSKAKTLPQMENKDIETENEKKQKVDSNSNPSKQKVSKKGAKNFHAEREQKGNPTEERAKYDSVVEDLANSEKENEADKSEKMIVDSRTWTKNQSCAKKDSQDGPGTVERRSSRRTAKNLVGNVQNEDLKMIDEQNMEISNKNSKQPAEKKKLTNTQSLKLKTDLELENSTSSLEERNVNSKRKKAQNFDNIEKDIKSRGNRASRKNITEEREQERLERMGENRGNKSNSTENRLKSYRSNRISRSVEVNEIKPFIKVSNDDRNDNKDGRRLEKVRIIDEEHNKENNPTDRRPKRTQSKRVSKSAIGKENEPLIIESNDALESFDYLEEEIVPNRGKSTRRSKRSITSKIVQNVKTNTKKDENEEETQDKLEPTLTRTESIPKNMRGKRKQDGPIKVMNTVLEVNVEKKKYEDNAVTEEAEIKKGTIKRAKNRKKCVDEPEIDIKIEANDGKGESDLNVTANTGPRKRSMRRTSKLVNNVVNGSTAVATQIDSKIDQTSEAPSDEVRGKNGRARSKRALPNPPELQDESSLQVKLKLRREKIETMEKLGIQNPNSNRKPIESTPDKNISTSLKKKLDLRRKKAEEVNSPKNSSPSLKLHQRNESVSDDPDLTFKDKLDKFQGLQADEKKVTRGRKKSASVKKKKCAIKESVEEDPHTKKNVIRAARGRPSSNRGMKNSEQVQERMDAEGIGDTDKEEKKTSSHGHEEFLRVRPSRNARKRFSNLEGMCNSSENTPNRKYLFPEDQATLSTGKRRRVGQSVIESATNRENRRKK